jgi:hypothetical protein
MKRFAAHYLFLSLDRFYKLHYIELDDRNYIQTIAPLQSEIAQTSFFNGVIVVSNNDFLSAGDLKFLSFNSGEPVRLYHLSGFHLSPPEFGAGNGGSDCHIQRLC